MRIAQVDQRLIETWQQELTEQVEEIQGDIQSAVRIWNEALAQMDQNDLIDQEGGLELPENGLADLENLLSQLKQKTSILSMAFVQLANQMKQQGLGVQADEKLIVWLGVQEREKLILLTAGLISVDRKLNQANEAFKENAASHELLGRVLTLFQQGASVCVIYEEEKKLPQRALMIPSGDIVRS